MFLNLSASLICEPAIAHETFFFNGGEPHIKINVGSITHIIPEQTTATITVQARSTNDIMLTVLAQDALQRLGFQKIGLFIPYFPAARQDRVMIPGEPLSAKVYARFINAADFGQVTVFDPHSDVTPALLDHCKAIPNHAFIREVMAHIAAIPYSSASQTDGVTASQTDGVTASHPVSNPLMLIAPDAGAAKKIHHLATALDWRHVVQCDKIRDVRTGQLSGAQVFSDDLQGANCLIVDDICDGGGTFIQLAQALKSKNAGRLFLAVSHGIFSKSTEILTAHFDQIFTTNSFYPGISESKVTVLDIFKFL